MGWHFGWMAAGALALLATPPAAIGQAKKKESAAAGTLDRIRSTGTLRLGYRTDARPFSYEEGTGNPAGFTVELCQRVQQAVKTELSLSELKVQWVPLDATTRLPSVQRGDVDVLCGAMSETLERRKQVDFSAPVFPGGVGALVRSDATKRLKNILEGEAVRYTPTWKAVSLNILREQVFAAVPGTTAEQWLKQKGQALQVQSSIRSVPDYQTGIQAVLDRQASAFFAERAVLLDAAQRANNGDDLTVLDRHFTVEPLALVLRRGDEDFRLLVDRTLSQLYNSADFTTLYTKWFGKPDEAALEFYRWNALPN
jgi:ABC-type amino acid transport substrate-binding protein